MAPPGDTNEGRPRPQGQQASPTGGGPNSSSTGPGNANQGLHGPAQGTSSNGVKVNAGGAAGTASSNAGGNATSNAAGNTSGQQSGHTLPLADLNRIVLEYLNKKGYTRTEAMLRVESSRTPTPASNLPTGVQGQGQAEAHTQSQGPPSSGNGAHIPASGISGQSTTYGGPAAGQRPTARPTTPFAKMYNIEDPAIYSRGYTALRDWTESSLDLYKPELRRILFPVFVHLFLELVNKNYTSQAKEFFEKFSSDHEVLHGQDIQRLSGISLPLHLEENELAKAFRSSKYQISVSRTTFDLLLYFLQEIESNGGAIIIRIINQYMETKVTTARPSRYDNANTLNPEEGLAGYRGDDQVDKFNSQPVKLGKLPLDPDFKKEVEQALQERDSNGAQQEHEGDTKVVGGGTLVDEFNKMTEESTDSPNRDSLPLPAYKGVDVDAEIQKVINSRARMKLGPLHSNLPSVCMYTFHNTYDTLNTLDFSPDTTLVAGGFSDSFIKIWSLKGEKVKSIIKSDDPSTSKRLIGHSGPVFGLSFSPDNRYLLSCSEDKTTRLWSMDTYTALVSYKGHNQPVWDVSFGPFGHYFATASHDQTARLWSCDHIYPLRIFAGHLSDVDTVTFHPNGLYLVTGSSDKTCRLWDVNRGNSVRVFIGHTGPVNCTAVSPDGRWMASAGEDSLINVWDLGSGRRLKSMRGHGRASITSLAFSMEGSVLVSTSIDNSVRVWDIKKGTSDAGPEPEPFPAAIGENGITENMSVDVDGRKKKEIVASSDHMAVFYTKKTPVYKAKFTQRNLCLTGGAFLG